MRVGKKKQPSYRVVVADARSPRDGRYIEIVGQYRPRAEPSEFVVDDEKVLAWLGRGAQPTEQVHRLLVAAGLWERYEAGRSRPSRTARRAGAREVGRRDARRRRSEADAAAQADATATVGEAAEPAGDGSAVDAEDGE
jgi:small subunit ribosomal protein S16